MANQWPLLIDISMTHVGLFESTERFNIEAVAMSKSSYGLDLHLHCLTSLLSTTHFFCPRAVTQDWLMLKTPNLVWR